MEISSLQFNRFCDNNFLPAASNTYRLCQLQEVNTKLC